MSISKSKTAPKPPIFRVLKALPALVWGVAAMLSGGPGMAADPPAPIASYVLEARLEASTHRVEGQGTLRWRNATEHPTAELYFHLYLNGFRNTESTWLREAGDPEIVETLAEGGGGWIEVERLEAELASGPVDLLAGLEFVAPDDGNPEDRTLARVLLPQPVEPGDVIELDVAFTSQLPKAVARTGFVGDHHLVAQWFPKLAVYQPDGTWHAHPFHRAGEFFADFGHYDVTLDVPEGYVVGATGKLTEARETDDGRQVLRYVQEDPPVHDFAWTAWPDFVERVHTFTHEGLPEVEVTLLLRPDTLHLEERYWRALEHGLRLFGTWFGPYPYETLTLVDPPHGARATGGMEYPTFLTAGTSVLSSLPTLRPEGVTIHELGHQWFYGLVATDEFQESYLDEGLTTRATARALDEAYGPRAWSIELFEVPWVFDNALQEHPVDTSARYFRAPTVDPIARTTWGYLHRDALRYMTYSKMSLVVEQLRRTMGPETFDPALKTYATRYRFRHPRTEDFLDVMREATDQDLGPFFRQVLFGSEILDYAVARAETHRRKGPRGVFEVGEDAAPSRGADELPGWESEVVVRRLGGVQLPVTVELTFEDGTTQRREWDGRDRWVRYRITGPKLLHAEVDPDEVLLLDVDRLNNSRRTEPDDAASRRWGQVIRFWLQNLFETFAAFS